MRTVRTIADLRGALERHRAEHATVGLVPTMGGFHDGHLSLIRRARQECDVVVVSLFVNPSQFEDRSDLEAYPRDEQRDAALAAELGTDYLFAPPPEAVYPSGFATTVSVAGVTEPLEGVHRGQDHFAGVATVVCKLLNMVGPDVAYFGQKDAQQALMVRRLVEDLNFPVQIEICPTVREADGLAMSSRNVRLDPAARRRAAVLYRALQSVQKAVAAGEHDLATARRGALAELESAGIAPEYLEVVSPDTLTPVREINGPALVAVAARVNGTRLIDNLVIEPPPVEAVATSNSTRSGSN